MRTLRGSACQGPAILTILFLASLSIAAAQSQQPDESSVIRGIDAAIKTRFEAVLGFTVIEHYVVFRGSDKTRPAAEMTVKTTYSKDTGKSYTILSESGSDIVRHFVLDALLENEKRINQPGNREASWFTSANYEMKLQPGGIQRIDGHDCIAVNISPHEKASNLIQGTIWVDAKDFSTVRIEGTATKSNSLLTGPAQVMRQYANLSGFAQATHARAVSDSVLFGQTIVTIDYTDYQIQLRLPK
jgi:hypothetical protein